MEKKREEKRKRPFGCHAASAAGERYVAAIAASILRCYDKWKRCEVISLCEREVKA